MLYKFKFLWKNAVPAHFPVNICNQVVIKQHYMTKKKYFRIVKPKRTTMLVSATSVLFALFCINDPSKQFYRGDT